MHGRAVNYTSGIPERTSVQLGNASIHAKLSNFISVDTILTEMLI
jgi:hypothetical protein